jgi:protein-disulfide isomerase
MTINGTVNRIVVVFAMLMILGVSAQAQTAAAGSTTGQKPANELEELRREVRDLKASQEQIRKELQEIKRLLLARQAAPVRLAPPEQVNISELPIRGNQDARVVVVEFSDFQCPYCGHFFREAMPQIDRDYIKTGKIKYAFAHVPLEQTHPSAFKAAESADCAGEQGKFWEMHDRLFANQVTLAPADLISHANALGLDMTRFSQCLSSGKNAAAVRKSMARAEDVGVEGTPTFLIGLVDAKNSDDGNIKVSGIIVGAQPYAVFKSAIEKALGAQHQ